MHIKLINGHPEKYIINQLRKENPQVSFPKNLTESVLAEYDVYPLTATDKPQVNHTKNVKEGVPEFVDGVWKQVWNVEDATPEEIEQRSQEQELFVREKRGRLLAETDWTALSDTTMSSEMTAYRQALRDITDQEGFPYEVIWPVKP